MTAINPHYHSNFFFQQNLEAIASVPVPKIVSDVYEEAKVALVAAQKESLTRSVFVSVALASAGTLLFPTVSPMALALGSIAMQKVCAYGRYRNDVLSAGPVALSQVTESFQSLALEVGAGLCGLTVAQSFGRVGAALGVKMGSAYFARAGSLVGSGTGFHLVQSVQRGIFDPQSTTVLDKVQKSFVYATDAKHWARSIAFQWIAGQGMTAAGKIFSATNLSGTQQKVFSWIAGNMLGTVGTSALECGLHFSGVMQSSTYASALDHSASFSEILLNQMALDLRSSALLDGAKRSTASLELKSLATFSLACLAGPLAMFGTVQATSNAKIKPDMSADQITQILLESLEDGIDILPETGGRTLNRIARHYRELSQLFIYGDPNAKQKYLERRGRKDGIYWNHVILKWCAPETGVPCFDRDWQLVFPENIRAEVVKNVTDALKQKYSVASVFGNSTVNAIAFVKFTQKELNDLRELQVPDLVKQEAIRISSKDPAAKVRGALEAQKGMQEILQSDAHLNYDGLTKDAFKFWLENKEQGEALAQDYLAIYNAAHPAIKKALSERYPDQKIALFLKTLLRENKNYQLVQSLKSDSDRFRTQIINKYVSFVKEQKGSRITSNALNIFVIDLLKENKGSTETTKKTSKGRGAKNKQDAAPNVQAATATNNEPQSLNFKKTTIPAENPPAESQTPSPESPRAHTFSFNDATVQTIVRGGTMNIVIGGLVGCRFEIQFDHADGTCTINITPPT